MPPASNADDSSIPDERQREILDLLATAGRVIATELSARFGCSGDTVRRDLDKLATEGRLQRVHGGAIALHPEQLSYLERTSVETGDKQAIAAATASLLPQDSVLVLDAGTTCLQLARALPADLRATIFTVAPEAAIVLAGHPGIRVELIPGNLLPETMAVVGPAAVRTLESLNPDVVVLGPCAVHPRAGLTVSHPDEQPIKAAMIARGTRVIALASHAKLGTVLPFTAGPIERLTELVVSAGADAADLDRYRAQGIAVTVAKESA